MAPRIIDKEEKRRQIAKAARQQFGLKGFANTKMDDVARAAGVGKGTIYEYFQDKESLLQDSFEILMGSTMGQMLDSLNGDLPPLQTLRELATATVKAMVGLGHEYRFFLEHMLHTSRVKDEYPLWRQMLTEFRKTVADLLSAAVQQGALPKDIDVNNAAAIYAAWFDGAYLHWIVIPEGPDLERMAEQFHESFLKGIEVITYEGKTLR